MEKIKLMQGYRDGSTMIKRCPVFSYQGIESLLYMEDKFNQITRVPTFKN